MTVKFFTVLNLIFNLQIKNSRLKRLSVRLIEKK